MLQPDNNPLALFSLFGLDMYKIGNDKHGCISQTLNSCLASQLLLYPFMYTHSSCMAPQLLFIIHTALAWLPNFELLYPLMYTHSSYVAPMVLNLLNQWLTSSADTTPTFQGGCSGWTACVQSSFWEQQSTLDMWVNVMCHVRWHVWHHSALIGLHICEYCQICVKNAHYYT